MGKRNEFMDYLAQNSEPVQDKALEEYAQSGEPFGAAQLPEADPNYGNYSFTDANDISRSNSPGDIQFDTTDSADSNLNLSAFSIDPTTADAHDAHLESTPDEVSNSQNDIAESVSDQLEPNPEFDLSDSDDEGTTDTADLEMSLDAENISDSHSSHSDVQDGTQAETTINEAPPVDSELELEELDWCQVKKDTFVVVCDKENVFITEGTVTKRSMFTGATINGTNYKPTKCNFFAGEPVDDESAPTEKPKSKPTPQPLQAEVYPPIRKPSIIWKVFAGTTLLYAVAASTTTGYLYWVSVSNYQSPQQNSVELLREELAQTKLLVTTLEQQSELYALQDELTNVSLSIESVKDSLAGLEQNQNMLRNQIAGLISTADGHKKELASLRSDTRTLDQDVRAVKAANETMSREASKQDEQIASLIKELKASKTASVNATKPKPVRYTNQPNDRSKAQPAPKPKPNIPPTTRSIGPYKLTSIDLWGGKYEATLEHDFIFIHRREGDYIDTYQIRTINQEGVVLQNTKDSKLVRLIK